MEAFLLIAAFAGFVVGLLWVVLSSRGASAEPPPRRRERDLFTLVVGMALGAALFGDDDCDE